MSKRTIELYEANKDELAFRYVELVKANIGIDPYILAVGMKGDYSCYPPPVDGLIRQVAEHYMKYMQRMEAARHRIPGF